MSRTARLVLACSLFVFVGSLLPALAADPAHNFVGAEKCKMCHNSPAKGAQFTKWTESAHSKAFQVLASDAAKKIAAAKNIPDPQKADECLRCHVAGHGASAAKLTEKYKVEDGVSCDRVKATAAGLVIPDEKTCTGCHNQESPTFKSFDFAAMHAKIAHKNPQGAAK
jgi:hypothetical protein